MKPPKKRLGSGAEGPAEIKRHGFFDPIDWKKLEARELPAPFKPEVKRKRQQASTQVRLLQTTTSFILFVFFFY